jgi:hypothetical protein
MNKDLQTLLSTAVPILGACYYFFNRISRIELKTDTLWDFFIRRAAAEAVSKGLGTVNSDLKITDETRSWYAGMAAELKEFYRTVGVRLTDREMFMEFESRFGGRIMKEICIPHGLFSGSCILAAIAVAKEASCVSSAA